MKRRLPAFFTPRAVRRLARLLLESLPMRERAFVVEALLSKPVTVETRHGSLKFLNHGRGSYKRARTLLSKEPDSLEWIDAMAPGSVFWDIGANIGTLSLYAARRGDLEVWAFEPAAVNFYNLTANCELNGLDGKLRCLLAGLGAAPRLGSIKASQLAPARSFTFRTKAGSTKGRPPGPPRTEQLAPIFTVDQMVDDYAVAPPTYIKIDVPGMTLDILRGADRTLASRQLRQIQVEARESGPGGRKVVEMLGRHGFVVIGRNNRRSGGDASDLVFGRPD